MTRNGLLVGAVIAVASLSAIPAIAGDGLGRGHGRHGRKRAAATARLKMFQALNFSADQRHLMIERSKAIEPIVESARGEARKIIADALVQAEGGDRDAIRTRTKEQLKALRQGAIERIAPLARDVVSSLTPEQRSKIAEFATKRGKTVDDEMLVLRFGRMLSRPMTRAYLEALDRAGAPAPPAPR